MSINATVDGTTYTGIDTIQTGGKTISLVETDVLPSTILHGTFTITTAPTANPFTVSNPFGAVDMTTIICVRESIDSSTTAFGFIVNIADAASDNAGNRLFTLSGGKVNTSNYRACYGITTSEMNLRYLSGYPFVPGTYHCFALYTT